MSYQAGVYFADGDLTVASPCGTPRLWYPFQGDSVYDTRDIVLLNSSNVYERVPVGTGYNLQPFSYNQQALMFDQEFVVSRAHYVPMALNTPYSTVWSLGWQNTLVNLGNCFLIEEGPLMNIGNGLVKFYRRFASLPPTRNVVESYAATFPAIDYGGSTIRFGKTRIVNSRVQFDYLVFDSANLLSLPLFPNGPKLNAVTGIAPVGLILPEMLYFKAEVDAVINHNLLDSDQPLADGPPATVPSKTEYAGFAGWTGSLAAEIVIEASSMRQWAGNIYERKTRFVVPQ